MLEEMPDNVVIHQALMMWRNYIETNNVTLSANDAVSMGRPESVRRLDDVQRRFVDRLEKLANRELESELDKSSRRAEYERLKKEFEE